MGKKGIFLPIWVDFFPFGGKICTYEYLILCTLCVVAVTNPQRSDPEVGSPLGWGRVASVAGILCRAGTGRVPRHRTVTLTNWTRQLKGASTNDVNPFDQPALRAQVAPGVVASSAGRIHDGRLQLRRGWAGTSTPCGRSDGSDPATALPARIQLAAERLALVRIPVTVPSDRGWPLFSSRSRVVRRCQFPSGWEAGA